MINLAIGQIVQTGTLQRSGKTYQWGAIPWAHPNRQVKSLIVRIEVNTHEIVGNPQYRFPAYTCFLESKWQGTPIRSIRITKINASSVCGEPVDYGEPKDKEINV